MKTKLKLPLNAIRVFVEAARQGSFVRAADFLRMTPGAVSQHVASLERYAGLALFDRSGPVVTLNDSGRQYFDAVQDCMSTIESATQLLARRQPAPARLAVRTSLPSLAMLNLIPSLVDFVTEHSAQLEVISSLLQPTGDEAYDVFISRDLAIPGAQQWLLAEECLICVAAPSRVAAWEASPQEWVFINALSRPELLPLWCSAQEPSINPGQVVASFAHYFLALSAAIAGLGALVVPAILAEQALQAGHLQTLPGTSVRGAGSYSAYLNPRSVVPELASRYCRWLKARFVEQRPAAFDRHV